MERPELILRITDLEKTYPGGAAAVKGVSLQIDRERIYALLGPNGAGKTTILKSIMNFINYRGTIEVFGQKMDRSRKRVSFVPEEKSLYENLDIERTIKLTASLSENFDEKRAREFVGHYRLPFDKKIRTFSNGMKTALYMSLALSSDCDLYILDEPTYGLDPILREDTLEFVREKVISGKTVLYTSHTISEVESLADEFFVMINGKIVYSGNMDDLKEKYRIIHAPLEMEAEIERKRCFAFVREQNRLSMIVESQRDQNSYREDVTGTVPDLEEFFQILVRSESHTSR